MAAVTNTSICGIGIGTENCYVAVARQGGIEILLNEYSQRSTPAYIGFGGNQREIGVTAKQKQMMNLKNTCFSPTLIIGKKFSQLNLQEIPYKVEAGPNDEVLVRVQHNGEELLLSPVQLLAMLFTKLRRISGNSVDCVINCPNFFDFVQRKAVFDAALIAGLNPLRIVSDMTAVALYYGFYRTFPSDISVVGFVDCGHNSSQAAIVLFNHKENLLKILDTEYQPGIGGKQFDVILANYFIEKYGLKLNERARYRLIAECEKLKKNLSANPNELPINIECLHDDRDFTGKIDRATFEEISQQLFDGIATMLKTTLMRAAEKFKSEFNDKEFRLDSIEIVGGTSRIPAIKRLIKDIFGMEPSTTLNADEAVARGCALQCAILSPTFKVAKELNTMDSVPFKLEFRTDKLDDKPILIYNRGDHFPYSRQITISSKNFPLVCSFDYYNLYEQKVFLSQYKIVERPGSNALQLIKEQNLPLKIRVRLDHNCLLSLTSAVIFYENKAEEELAAEQPSNDENQSESKMETDQQPDQNDQQKQVKRKKPKTVTLDLTIEPLFTLGHISEDLMNKFVETEGQLILADKNWKEKTDARNTLEEFIYEWRNRVESSDYDPFINPNAKIEFQAQLDRNEKWLFEQDEQEVMHSKAVYEELTESMKKAFANGIVSRKKEFEHRPRLLEQMGYQLQQARKLVEHSEPEEEEEVKKFCQEIEEKQKWFDDVSGKLSSMKMFDDPQFTCEDINNQNIQLQMSSTRLQNNRKRRVDEKKRQAEMEKQKQQENSKQHQDGDGQMKNEEQKMDVDPDEQSPNEQPTA